MWATLKPIVAAVAALLIVAASVTVVQISAPQQRASATTTAPAAAPSVFGRVVNSDGKPVPAARVVLLGSSDGTAPPPIATSANTDSDGRFQLPASAVGSPVANVLVQADGYRITGALLDADSEPDDPYEIVMPPAKQVSVKLIRPDGQPAPGVRIVPKYVQAKASPTSPAAYYYIELPQELRQVLGATSDDQGQCVIASLLDNGLTPLETSDERFAQIGLDNSATETNADGTKRLVITLHPAGGFSGRVVYSDTGKPAEGLRIAAHCCDETPSMGYDSDITDAQGNFHLKQLPPGHYNIAADVTGEMAHHYTVRAIENIALGSGQTISGQDLRLVPGTPLTGKVTIKGSSEPVPGIELFIFGPAHPRSGSWAGTVNSGPDGSFALRLPPGQHVLTIVSQAPPGLQKPKTGAKEITILDGTPATVAFEFTRAAESKISGRVVDPDGKPVGHATVCVNRPSREVPGTLFEAVRSDAEGNFTIFGAPEGTLLRARKGQRWMTEQPLKISGNAPKDVVLTVHKDVLSSARVRIVGTDGKPLQGIDLQLSRQVGDVGYPIVLRTTNVQGTCVFDALEPDISYLAFIDSRGFGTGEANIHPQPGKPSDYQIEVPRADSFVGGMVIDEAGQPVPAMTLSISGARSPWQQTKTDVAGRFHVDNIVADEEVSISIDGDFQGRPMRFAAGKDDVVILFHPSPQKPQR
jgi:protocatechuate 3,4-dioxygenase beta subunit